ncbi:MAG TPA: formate dehydrogenase subunit delta [Burkholderiaceae bacterium]|nr:formate dehydrogenase subunit delta [Burkholderiaceae bacterium]
MNVEHLVTMANQIGAFFASQGQREDAVKAIADHLRRFWEPRMRDAIGRYVAAGGEGLREEVAEAVRRLGATPEALPQRRPAPSTQGKSTSG